MFVAGLIPGLVLLVLLWAYSFFFGIKYTKHKKIAMSEIWAATWDIKWELPLPVIVIGGILSGIFSG